MNAQQTKQKGFTIIEVVLVLAIAGLIFLMVFIALPALQRNQRDTARKSEVSKVLSSITTYQSNSRGKSPDNTTSGAAAFAKYLDARIESGAITLESGTTVTKSTMTPATTAAPVADVTEDNIVYVIGAKCADTPGDVVKGTGRQAAALITLENGNAVYCQTS